MLLSLAIKLGFKSLRDLQENLTAYDVCEWLAYFMLDKEEAEKEEALNELIERSKKNAG